MEISKIVGDCSVDLPFYKKLVAVKCEMLGLECSMKCDCFK